MIRLNLGCAGYQKVPDYLNVDIMPEHEPDLVADVTSELHWHFPLGTVDEIYAGHLLEHLWEPIPVLRYWRELLRPGGLLTVVIPDAVKILRDRGRGEQEQDGMLHPGKHSGVVHANLTLTDELWAPPLGHCQLLDAITLRLWLEHVGFRSVTAVDIAQDPRLYSHIGWQSGMDAVK